MIPVLYVNDIIYFNDLFVFSGSSVLFRAREERCATTVSILPINRSVMQVKFMSEFICCVLFSSDFVSLHCMTNAVSFEEDCTVAKRFANMTDPF